MNDRSEKTGKHEKSVELRKQMETADRLALSKKADKGKYTTFTLLWKLFA